MEGYHTGPQIQQAPVFDAPEARAAQHAQSSFDDFEEQLSREFTSQAPVSKNPYFTSSIPTTTSPHIETRTAATNPLRLSSNNPFANRSIDQSDSSERPRSDSPEAYSEPASAVESNRNPFMQHRPEQLSFSSARSTKTSYSEEIQTPIEPSSKALGKMRRFSRRGDEEEDGAEEMERRAEEELRERYRLEAEQKARRGH